MKIIKTSSVFSIPPESLPSLDSDEAVEIVFNKIKESYSINDVYRVIGYCACRRLGLPTIDDLIKFSIWQIYMNATGSERGDMGDKLMKKLVDYYKIPVRV